MGRGGKEREGKDKGREEGEQNELWMKRKRGLQERKRENLLKIAKSRESPWGEEEEHVQKRDNCFWQHNLWILGAREE